MATPAHKLTPDYKVADLQQLLDISVVMNDPGSVGSNMTKHGCKLLAMLLPATNLSWIS